MNIIISNNSNLPIYQQIIDQIKQSILNGELAEGEPLPSIRQLAKDLRISVITTKRAYEELEKEGLLESVVGKGSFVSPQNKELIRERRLKQLEEKLEEVVIESKLLQLTEEDIIDILQELFKEEKE